MKTFKGVHFIFSVAYSFYNVSFFFVVAACQIKAFRFQTSAYVLCHTLQLKITKKNQKNIAIYLR